MRLESSMSKEIVGQVEGCVALRANRPTIVRGWMPYAVAAEQYLGVSKDILLGAIKAHQLRAYEKPLTRGRTQGAQREHHSYFVCLADVDEYIRTYWTPAFS